MAAILTATKYAKKIRLTLGNSLVNFTVNGIEIIANVQTIIRKIIKLLKGGGMNKNPGIKIKPVGATKIQLVTNQAKFAEKTCLTYGEFASSDAYSKIGMYTLTIKFSTSNPRIKNTKYFTGMVVIIILDLVFIFFFQPSKLKQRVQQHTFQQSNLL